MKYHLLPSALATFINSVTITEEGDRRKYVLNVGTSPIVSECGDTEYVILKVLVGEEIHHYNWYGSREKIQRTHVTKVGPRDDVEAVMAQSLMDTRKSLMRLLETKI